MIAALEADHGGSDQLSTAEKQLVRAAALHGAMLEGLRKALALAHFFAARVGSRWFMGAWRTGLYASDFAADLRAVVAAVARLPLDEDGLVTAICGAEKSAAENAADEDHTVFWLVLADQFEKRGIFSARVRDTALAIIDGGKDAAIMQKLGMKPADLRKRAAKLGELRVRIVAQRVGSKPRKTMQRPEPYVFEVGGVYAYPTRGGDTINPYMGAKYFDRSKWSPDGFGLMLVIGRRRAFDYLAWYQAAASVEVVPSIPDRTNLARYTPSRGCFPNGRPYFSVKVALAHGQEHLPPATAR